MCNWKSKIPKFNKEKNKNFKWNLNSKNKHDPKENIQEAELDNATNPSTDNSSPWGQYANKVF